jgi:hypothetical protein
VTSRASVVASAVIAAIVSTYPLLLGASVHSPLLGGVGLLYAGAPYTPGTPPRALENPRAVDMLAPLTSTLPKSAIERRALANAEWPLWNRYSALGRPLHGQGQPSILDPLHLLSLIPVNVAFGADLKIVATRILFASGVALVAFELGGPIAGIAVGVVAPFSGVFLERLAHPAQFPLGYAPWLLLGYLIAARAPASSPGALALIWIATGLLIVGSPAKDGAAHLMLLHAAGLAMLVRGRPLRIFAPALAAGLLLVACVTAPHWLVFLDTWRRAITAYDMPNAVFAGWREVVGLTLGPAMPGTPTPSLHVLAITLAVAALVSGEYRRSSRAVAIVITVSVALSVALGLLPARWIAPVPLVGNLQRVGSLLFAATLVPILAIVACSVGRRLRARAAAAAAILVVAVCACGAVFVSPVFLASPRMAWFAAATLLVGSIVPAALTAARAPLAHGAIALVVALVLIPGGLHLPFGVAPVDSLLMQPPRRTDYSVPSRAIDQFRASTPVPYRVTGLDGVLRSGTQGLYGVEAVLGHDALTLPHFEELMVSSGVTWHQDDWERRLSSRELALSSGVLRMFGVRLLLAPDTSDLGTRADDEPLRLLEQPEAWPRAFFTDSVSSYSALSELIDQLGAIRTPFASIEASDLEAVQAARPLVASVGRNVVPAVSYQLTTNRTTFDLDAPGAGVAVLMEAWVAEDFEATLNGQSVPYFRANHIAKAVVVPAAGRWEVSFRYRPRLWTLSWALAGGGSVGLMTLVALIRRGSVNTSRQGCVTSASAIGSPQQP